MPQMTIELPLPDKRLHPNSAASWRAKIKPKKDARRAAYLVTLATLSTEGFIVSGVLKPGLPAEHVTITPGFQYKVNRKRDGDGALSWLKHYIDGIADGMATDDHKFTFLPVVFPLNMQAVLPQHVQTRPGSKRQAAETFCLFFWTQTCSLRATNLSEYVKC